MDKKTTVASSKNFKYMALFWGSLITFGFYMLFLNSKTPLIADDYVYTFIFGTTTSVTSFSDIVTSQITYFMTWGGRVLAESLTQIFMLLGKNTFNIANTLCLCVFILGVYFNGVGRKIKPWMLLITIALVWFFIPMFGQTVMWLTGACNYLWCGTIILLALLPFRLYEEAQTKALSSLWFSLIMIPLFFLSGITNENTAGGMILIMGLFGLIFYKRKIKIPPFVYTALFFSVLGFGTMMLAPGNFMRVDNEGAVAEVTAIVGGNPIITRLSYFAYNLYDLMPLIIIVGIVFGVILWNRDKINGTLFKIFVIGGCASMLVMLVPPKFPPRAMFGVVSFLLIAVIYGIDQVKISKEKLRRYAGVPIASFIIYFVMSLGYVGIDAMTVSKQYEQRVAIIESNKEAPVIAVPEIKPLSSHNGMYGLRDVQSDPNHWVNRGMADYYGVSNIVRE
ncbi:MAG: DUF3329 domain-containing protein [Eubacteriaceae bacterium]